MAKRRKLGRRKKAGEYSKGKLYIGIDNGVSGSIGWVDELGVVHGTCKTPTFSEQNYTKKKGNITRVDFVTLRKYLYNLATEYKSIIVLFERPMINPGRWKATISAVRALESTLLTLEDLQLPYRYVDSKEWQKVMLPKGVKGDAELKKASLEIGGRLFPKLKFKKDADGILIAEWGRRERL